MIRGFFISALALLVLSWLKPSPGSWGRENADVGVPVNGGLADAGIEIPFPHRDVRLHGKA